ncbi:hypothetical protein XENOCAPTIV_007242 [Xenoophorus captivus]|uniref:Uncharacterized protein n=1 Tax=Xenoophorus captivus TaxID=1517983 RepID=A0ABV0QC26_9TELE
MLPLFVQGEADGITVTEAIGPFIKKTHFIDLPRQPWSLETFVRLRRHDPNEVSTSNKCPLLQDLSRLQCFNQRVTVDGFLCFTVLIGAMWSVVAVNILNSCVFFPIHAQ